jgi:nicotinamidase-related amidase
MKINRSTTALLVMHWQINMIIKLPVEDKIRVLANVAKVISAARKCHMPIIYVIARFRNGYPEVSPRNSSYYKKKADNILMEGNPEVEISSEVRPQTTDVIVINKRHSAFTGSDLEIILRSNGIDTLVLSGMSTSGVVESTARQAFDMDYQIFVLGDCCVDRVEGAHEAALKYMMPRISTVCTSDEFVASISDK